MVTCDEWSWADAMAAAAAALLCPGCVLCAGRRRPSMATGEMRKGTKRRVRASEAKDTALSYFNSSRPVGNFPNMRSHWLSQKSVDFYRVCVPFRVQPSCHSH